MAKRKLGMTLSDFAALDAANKRRERRSKLKAENREKSIAGQAESRRLLSRYKYQ